MVCIIDTMLPSTSRFDFHLNDIVKLSASPGQGCIKHLKISGSFLQPFAAFRWIFLCTLLGHSADGGLLRIGKYKKSARKSFKGQGMTAENLPYLLTHVLCNKKKKNDVQSRL